MDLNDYNKNTRTKVIVYGRPKTGKTALVGKLASAGFKLHWLDLENGIKTLLNPAMLDPKYRTNVDVINIPDHRMYPVAIDTVREVMRGGPKKICAQHGKVNCPVCLKDTTAGWGAINLSEFTDNDILVIDSLSQLGMSAMNKSVLKEISKPGGEDYKATYTDYMMQGALLDQVLSMIQVLDLNICVISHVIDIEKAETKEQLVPLVGTRNFSSNAGKYFDTIVYTTLLNKAHRAYSSTAYSSTAITGSRVPVEIDDAKGDALSLLPLFKRGA
jgi:hypothetical protein